MRGRRASRGGFTLLELVLVMAIVGLMVGLSTLRLDFMIPKYRLRAAAREVGSTMKQGKARAAATGKDVYLEMDLSKGAYWLLVAFPKTKDSSPGGAPAFEYEALSRRALPDGVEFVDVITGEKAKAESGRTRVRMTPFGTSTHVIVNLRNKDKRELSVKLNGFTGFLSFYDEYKDADELLGDEGP
jgi:prepilin-type N-terminal cleavage/methylation domain-containing protein